MTTKIADIAYEIFEELGEPDNASIPSIAFWLRANVSKLNILLDTKYIIDSSLEIVGPNPNKAPFTLIEKSILQKMFMVSYYEKMFRNSLGAASIDSVVSVTDDGSTVVKINKNEIAKNYSQLKVQSENELHTLIKSYHSNEISPIQVAGDDIIESYKDVNDNRRNLNYGS